MDDQQSGQGTDGDGGSDGLAIEEGREGVDDSSPSSTPIIISTEMKQAPLQAPAPMEPHEHHYSDAETTDDDDSFAALNVALLKKYAATRRTGIQQHKRNSVIEAADMDDKDDSTIASEDVGSTASTNDFVGGNRRSSVGGIVVGGGDKITPGAATAIALRSPAPAEASSSSQLLQPAPPPPRRSIFPHLRNVAETPADQRKDLKASKASQGSSSLQKAQPQQPSQQARHVQQHHRRSSHSFEREDQTQTQTHPSQLHATLLSPLKMNFPPKTSIGASESTSSISLGDKSSASKASTTTRPRCLPSNEDLINAMDDKYDPDKSARHQQVQKRRQFRPNHPLQSSPAASMGNSRSVGDAGKSTTFSSISSFQSNREGKHLRPATATEIAARGKALAGEAASGEIVYPAANKYIPASPRRKTSLFFGGSLPKVQHTPLAQPEIPLSPRSPPRAHDAIKPLPSILRKTSSSFTSPIILSSPGAAGRSGQKMTHRTMVSFGGSGSGVGSSALDESSNGSVSSSRHNGRRPEVSRSSSEKTTRSELEHRLQQTQDVARTASRDESSVGSSSTIRSSSSLRRVNSENSMASSVETERKRVTAITLASVASAASEKEIPAEDSNGKRTYKKKSLTRHGSLEMCTAMNKEISFDPHVWVVEYEQDEGNKWFTAAELERFKCEAIERIRRRHAQQQLVPSGTGRIIPFQMVQRSGSGRALFTDPALGCNEEGNEEDVDVDNNDNTPAGGSRPQVASSFSAAAAAAAAAASPIPSQVPPSISASDERRIQRTLLSEIRNILVVDPHPMFLKLFGKALHAMMSHVIVTTATSAEEAQRRIAAAKIVYPQAEGGATHGFDIIIVEERLQLFQRHRGGPGSNRKQQRQAAGDEQKQRQTPASGSALIRQIAAEQQESLEALGRNRRPRSSLLIGVSAHIQLDGDKLSRAGADLVWGKPPPPFDDALRLEILRLVLSKRAKPIYF